jgi:hypothetical protein
MVLRTGYGMAPMGLGIPVFGRKPSPNRARLGNQEKFIESQPIALNVSKVRS